MCNIKWRVMCVIKNGYQCLAWMVTVLVVLRVWCRPNLSTLKSVLLMHSKTSAGVLDCKERTTQGLNWGEQQVGVDHYSCMDTHTHNTRTHTHIWLDYHSRHADMQHSDGRSLTHHRVFDCVDQADDVGSPTQVFKNFNFPFDLLLLNRLWFKIMTVSI